MGGTNDRARWRRYLALVLDGLRATDRPTLPGNPGRFASLDEVIAVTKRHGRARPDRFRQLDT